MRRHLSISLVVALAATLALAGPSPASASGTVTFYGSGYGHGLGMSQWGAYGLALEGWGSGKILTSKMVSALITDDHRVLVGLVTPDTLAAVAPQAPR